MSDKTGIEWCDATWNPVTGCTKVSEGCRRCYAATFAERWRGTPGHYFENGFDLTLRPDKLNLPNKWKSPKKIFVNSMSDLFHIDVPDDFIDKVFETMCTVPQHTYMILTKRPERMVEYLNSTKVLCNVCMGDGCPYCYGGKISWKDHPYKNVWLGTSVENQKAADERVPLLLQTPAAIRFLSCEPLLGQVDIAPYLWDIGTWEGYEHEDHIVDEVYSTSMEDGINWVIVGGESGHGARPMHPDWARSLRDQCQAAGVSFFFKQFGEWAPLESNRDYSFVKAANLRFIGMDGKELSKSDYEPAEAECMYRYGKKTAGRLLDGREWNEFPEVTQ